MGVSVETMNYDHDDLHRAIALFFGLPSHSMRVAEGEALNHHDSCLANLEEVAILHLQRYLYAATNVSNPSSYGSS